MKAPEVLVKASDFGHTMLEHWALDPQITYLNHGTVGAPPRRVLEAQRRIRDQIELQPARFLLRELSAIAVGGGPLPVPRMRAAANAVAAFLGTRGADLVFVDNATTGVNAVLGSLELGPGDEILITDHTYGAIGNAARHIAGRRGARVRAVELPYPPPADGTVAELIEAAIGPGTRVAIVDHITSETALLHPLAEIARRCHARGVPVLVDGAHAPGAIPLEIPALGVDWYVGNLHKWAYAPRSCGILWAPPERQAGLHPTVISWGLDQGFTTEFDLVGTRDPSAHLTAPDGIAYMRELGVDAVRAYNHGLAWDAARFLIERWGTGFALSEHQVATMATVPLPESAGATCEDAARLRDGLLFEDRIEAQIHARGGRLWVRVSGQVYVEMTDVRRMAECLETRWRGKPAG